MFELREKSKVFAEFNLCDMRRSLSFKKLKIYFYLRVKLSNTNGQPNFTAIILAL